MLYRIQSTALGQSGNTLLILPNATITVRDANGDLARLFADPDEITEIPNPTLSDAAGGYDFYVEYGDYYDITVALNGQSVDDRVYPIDMGLGARVDAAAGIATTKAGEANTSAVTSQAWAESDTAPGDPGTKSAKTWAGEAAVAAARVDLVDGVWFDSIEGLAADDLLTYAPNEAGSVAVGKYINLRAAGYALRVVASNSTTYDFQTNGGVRVIKSPFAQGFTSADTRPAYVNTIKEGLKFVAPENVRSGLPTTLMPGGGYAEEMEITVTGVKGSNVLTTAETSKVSGLGSSGFDASITSDGGVSSFVICLGHNGSTEIYLRDPLAADFSGVFCSRIDNALGQHLTQSATKALAGLAARADGVTSARGGIIDGVWTDRPGTYYSGVWSKNAALTAYGVSNSAAPIVQSNIFGITTSANVWGNLDQMPVRPISLSGRGIIVGTHLAGHGVDGVVNLQGKGAVVEFWTGAYRGPSVDLTSTEISVVLKADGVVLSDTTTDHILRRHQFFVSGADQVTIELTNLDGGIYNIEVGQLTAREAGYGGKLIPSTAKVACFGDSWFAFYDGLFARELAKITGAKVDNYALGGMTTFWALSWFDTYIKGKGYDVVVLNFFTNDGNDLSAQTFTDPDGNEQPRWPSGLTPDEALQLWIDNMQVLCTLIQAEGARPVIMGPLGTQKNAQWTFAIDRPHKSAGLIPLQGELADSTSFLNNNGKALGVAASSGQGVVYAEGSDPTDGWGNPLNDAIASLQKLTLTASDYSAPYTFDIGTDTDANGLSDGIGYLTNGTVETNGETFTPSIVSGNQRFASAFTSPNTGTKRLKLDFSVTEAKEYIVMAQLANAPASTAFNLFVNLVGGYNLAPIAQRTTDADGNANAYWRQTADSTKTASILLAFDRVNGSTITFDLTKAYCIDLAALYAAAPNTKTMTDAQIVDFVMGLL